MPPADRTGYRNVHVWDVHQPEMVFGGLRLVDRTMTTHWLFREMLDIIVTAGTPYTITHRESGRQILRDRDKVLESGNYDLESEDKQTPLVLSTETFLTRATSRSLSPRDSDFRTAVRLRDRKSVIGQNRPDPEMIAQGFWEPFQAAHIFPMAFESHISTAFESGPAYEAYRLSTGEFAHLSSGINSPRNGMLLESSLHALWDAYHISVNPQNDYRVTSFAPNSFAIEGTQLDEVCRMPGDRLAVSDELLQWHFRQAVLANMRGAGEPVFEQDFPPGSDMVGEILQAPGAAKRMEFELFSRLYLHQANGETLQV